MFEYICLTVTLYKTINLVYILELGFYLKMDLTQHLFKHSLHKINHLKCSFLNYDVHTHTDKRII